MIETPVLQDLLVAARVATSSEGPSYTCHLFLVNLTPSGFVVTTEEDWPVHSVLKMGLKVASPVGDIEEVKFDCRVHRKSTGCCQLRVYHLLFLSDRPDQHRKLLFCLEPFCTGGRRYYRYYCQTEDAYSLYLARRKYRIETVGCDTITFLAASPLPIDREKEAVIDLDGTPITVQVKLVGHTPVRSGQYRFEAKILDFQEMDGLLLRAHILSKTRLIKTLVS